MSAPPFDDTNRVAVFGSQLLGVLIVIATVFTQQGELHSWRPTGTKNQPAAKDDQNADKFARLWDDPLEDFQTFPVAAASPSPTPRSGRAAVQNQARPAGVPASGSVPVKYTYTFLWNIVDARPLPEITERRLRTRYALVSAILAEGYLPLRESVLSTLPYGDVDTSPIIGLFETFRKPEDPNTWRYVSVIWTPKQLDFKGINKPENFWFLPEEQDRIRNTIWTKDVPDLENKQFEGDFWILHHGNSDEPF